MYLLQTAPGHHPALAGEVASPAAEWNTIIEEGGGASESERAAARLGAPGKASTTLEDLSGASRPEPRIVTGLAELDRVAGGGFVAGSATLIGGEPGDRQGPPSLIQGLHAAVARAGGRDIWRLREKNQPAPAWRLRAARIGLAEAPVQLAAQTLVEDIVATMGSGDAPKFVVIDSIQTMWSDAIESAPGTVSQVRGSAQALHSRSAMSELEARRCSSSATSPRTKPDHAGHSYRPSTCGRRRLLLLREGDGAHRHRLLRAAKNRFGATDEVGVFEMTGAGLAEVPNPSALFLAGRDGGASPGAAVFAGVEGARPLLVEIQALVAPTALGTPRRAVVGWEPSRLAMVLAVLESHGGLKLGQYDVYLNVAGA